MAAFFRLFACLRQVDRLGAVSKLIITDMDGTLLNQQREIPEAFWPVIHKLLDRGIFFAPASGRQYATLAEQFAPIIDRISVIAENGNMVVRDGEVVDATNIAPDTVRAILAAVQKFNETHTQPLGLVICGQQAAYYTTPEGLCAASQAKKLDAYPTEVATYYHANQQVADLKQIIDTDGIVKLAVFCETDVEQPVEATDGSAAISPADYLAAQAQGLRSVVSGSNWVDLFSPEMNKGVALQRLQEHLGVSATDTIVFVDYLNDLELIDNAGRSFAMANAHPKIAELATDMAPSNVDEGVVVKLQELFADLLAEPA